MSYGKTVKQLATNCNLTQDAVSKLFEELFKLAVEEVKGPTGRFAVPGLLRAAKRQASARTVRNPRTGQLINLEAKTVVRLGLLKRVERVLGNLEDVVVEVRQRRRHAVEGHLQRRLAPADAPACPECGSLMTRNGSCYRCHNCGTTSGCG